MRRALPDPRLIRVSKALKADLEMWREGVSLERDSGKAIGDLLKLVAQDRWRLAREQRRHANVMLRSPRPPYRSAISRYYYTMYHSMRACSYIFHEGDDHEEHAKLPANIPGDFPNKGAWQNRLKDARLLRNRADYDPYPTADRAWQGSAKKMRVEAAEMLSVAKVYLVGKGCTL